MSKKIQLNIPKPCHEDWDAMTPVDKGRFCGSCQKQVVDFSNMSDRQVAEFFKKPSTGSVCGRFMTDQLGRDIQIPKKRIPWFKYFFTIALPAFVVSLKSTASYNKGRASISNLVADTTRKPVYKETKLLGQVAKPENLRPFMGDTVVAPVTKTECTTLAMGKPSIRTTKGEIAPVIKEDLHTIAGVVLDEFGNKCPGLTVAIKGRPASTVTNEKGEFKIAGKKDDTLIFTGGMIETKEVKPDAKEFITVHVKQVTVLGGEVVVVAGGVSVKRSNETVVKGLVTDENNNPVPFASIETPDKKILIADEQGNFEIKTKKKISCGKLKISAAGYEPKEYIVGREGGENGTEIIRLETKGILKEVVVVSRPGIGCRWITGSTKLIMGAITDGIEVTGNKAEISTLPAENSIRLFPNPVSAGSNLTIGWKQAEEGYYSIQIINMPGQIVHQKEIWIDADARLLNMDMPAVSAGSYFLVLFNKKTGKKYSEKVIVQ